MDPVEPLVLDPDRSYSVEPVLWSNVLWSLLHVELASTKVDPTCVDSYY